MADPFSTAAAVVSSADVMIRVCNAISTVITDWREAPAAVQRLQQTIQNVQAVLGNLRLYVVEYEESRLFTEQQQPLPELVKQQLRDIHTDLSMLQQIMPPSGTQGKATNRITWVTNKKRILAAVQRLDSRQINLMTGLQIVAQ